MHASWWSCILHPLQLVLMLWTLLNQVRKMYSRCCMLYLCVVDNAYICYARCTAYLIMYIILNVHLIHTTPQHYTPHHTKPHNTSAIYTSPHHTTQHLTNIIFTTPHLTTLQHIYHASLHHSTPHRLIPPFIRLTILAWVVPSDEASVHLCWMEVHKVPSRRVWTAESILQIVGETGMHVLHSQPLVS